MERLTEDVILRAAASIVALIGLVILVQSPEMGRNAANAALARTGSMDTGQFLAVLQANMDSYRWLGAILLVAGAFWALHVRPLRP